MFLENFVKLCWILATLYHGILLWKGTSVALFRYAIPIAVVISVWCGRLFRWRHPRAQLVALPRPLVPVVVMLTGVAYSNELNKEIFEHSVHLGTYLYERVCFWGLLCLNATNVSQVVLPMFMVVRPIHSFCILVSMTLQRMVWH